MNLKDFVTTFEEVSLTDPFDQKDSWVRSKEIIDNYRFSKKVYTKMTKKEAPKLVFLPSRNLCRSMILANLIFSKKDTLEQFLLRFGL